MSFTNLLKNLWAYRRAKNQAGIVIYTAEELKKLPDMQLNYLHGAPSDYEEAIETTISLAEHYKARLAEHYEDNIINSENYIDDFHNTLDLVRLSKFLELYRRSTQQ